MKANVRTISTFATYGLNAKHNILQAPRCTCGCGKYANLVLENDDDVYGFIYAMLDEYDCEHCGVFVRKRNNDLVFGLKLDGDIKCYTARADKESEATKRNVKESVASMQKELKLHCYGLLEQVGDNLYKIVMD